MLSESVVEKLPHWHPTIPLPLGRGREATTYGRVHTAIHKQTLDGAVVSHSAELVRGTFSFAREGPLIRPYWAPSPQGEKGRVARVGELTKRSDAFAGLPGV